MRPGTGSTVVIQTDRRGRPAHLPARPVLRCRAARVLSAPRGAVKSGGRAGSSGVLYGL